MNEKNVFRGVLLGAMFFSSGCGSNESLPDMNLAPGLVPEVRPDTPGNGLQFNFDPGDVVETAASPSTRVLVHFTRNGPNAVPAKDGDASGVPDFVEEVMGVYDEVLASYEGAGFRLPRTDEGLPDNGGDGKFDVYLVDFAGVGDGTFQVDACDPVKTSQCAGYMVQENDYQGYGYPSTLVANRILASHEFFHGVQAAYDRDQGNVFAEGTAVWATESFDASLNDFEWFIDGYLDNTSRSLDVSVSGPVDAFGYGAGLFFQFLEENYGAGTVRALVERTEDGAFGQADPQWLDATDKLLATSAQSTFSEAFVEFATWNLFLGSKADPTRSYVNAAKYPQVKMTLASAPYVDPLRLFYASAQYYRVPTSGRTKMTAALTSTQTALQETENVVLLIVTERNGQVDPVVRVADVRAGVEQMDTAEADAFVAVAINTAMSGNSRKPTLCIGSPEEVVACKKSVEMTDGGGGVVDPPDDAGCGCRMVPNSPHAGFAALAAWSVLAYGRARRRRPRAMDKPT